MTYQSCAFDMFDYSLSILPVQHANSFQASPSATQKRPESPRISAQESQALQRISVTRSFENKEKSSEPYSPTTTFFLELTEDQMEELASKYTPLFIDFLTEDRFTPPYLTFAAEIAGRAVRGQEIVSILGRLIEHESALVREGAVYGSRYHINDSPEMRERVKRHTDPSIEHSPGVRSAARAALKA